jgi:hypothetical protein
MSKNKNLRSLWNILYISGFLLASNGGVNGATIVASGCSAAQVQSAINSAQNGDIVQVPAGSASWSSMVTTGKSIRLQGAGIGLTNITNNLDVATSCITISPPAGGLIVVSGFTFSTTPSAQHGIISISSPGSGQFRLTNCRINIAPSSPTVSYRGIVIWGAAYGVIDHCYFYNSSSAGQGVSFARDGSYTLTYCPPWFTRQVYGGINVACVEDCTFDFPGGPGDGAFDAYDGSIFVFRHNTVKNTNIGWHGADSGLHAPRLWEIYDNTITNTQAHIYTAIRARGGTGVVWNNTVTGLYDSFFILSEYRADPTYSSAVGALGSAVDGNLGQSGYPSSYPLLDQLGRGSFPQGTPWPNQGSYTAAQYEALEPIYQWGNNVNGNTAPTASPGLPDQSSNYIRQGYDYFDNSPKPGYVPLVYPHPLVASGVTTGTQAPAAPQSLRVVP